MNEYSWNLDQSLSIAHFGILGMHWGVRRYQNADGSLTAAGKKRYDQLEAQAAEYDKSAASYSKKASAASAHYEDIKKNGKKVNTISNM